MHDGSGDSTYFLDVSLDHAVLIFALLPRTRVKGNASEPLAQVQYCGIYKFRATIRSQSSPADVKINASIVGLCRLQTLKVKVLLKRCRHRVLCFLFQKINEGHAAVVIDNNQGMLHIVPSFRS